MLAERGGFHGDAMGDSNLMKALLRYRDALMAHMTESQAALRQVEEAIEAEERPTVRPPSQPKMEAVELPKVEIVRRPR